MARAVTAAATPAELSRRFPSYDVFGAKITPTTADDLLEIIRTHVEAGEQCIVASQNLHGLRVLQDDSAFRTLHALPETYVHIDGMPIVGLCRLAGVPARRDHRVTLLDVIWPLLRLAAALGWRVFWIGGTTAVQRLGLAEVRLRVPGLQVEGVPGYFDPQGESGAGVASTLAEYRPHVVLVGMGMGRQEGWILAQRRGIAPACFFTVGACLEYIAGTTPTPPRWMGRIGLEWLFRLARDPARFWHRYLIEPWPVAVAILRARHRADRRR
jgi:N-acetylglucosaminyldiphosphoundecaprenol N-acetyl-beta-D-mannosaminyltransferase